MFLCLFAITTPDAVVVSVNVRTGTKIFLVRAYTEVHRECNPTDVMVELTLCRIIKTRTTIEHVTSPTTVIEVHPICVVAYGSELINEGIRRM